MTAATLASTSRYKAPSILPLGSNGFLPTRLAQILTVIDGLSPEIVRVAAPTTALVIHRTIATIGTETNVTSLNFVTMPSVSRRAGPFRRITRATCTDAKHPSARLENGNLLPTRSTQIFSAIDGLHHEVVYHRLRTKKREKPQKN